MDYVITQKDYERIQAAVRWYERNKNSLIAPHRRQRIAPPGGAGIKYYQVNNIDYVNKVLTVNELTMTAANTWSQTGPSETCYPSPCYGYGVSELVMTHYKLTRPIAAIKVNGYLVALPGTPGAFAEYAP